MIGQKENYWKEKAKAGKTRRGQAVVQRSAIDIRSSIREGRVLYSEEVRT